MDGFDAQACTNLCTSCEKEKDSSSSTQQADEEDTKEVDVTVDEPTTDELITENQPDIDTDSKKQGEPT
ncbi:MAG: hypothetical protein H6765_10080 [Candidatus Peribacteria bacterium]|nr:MAG: hypothetical protein H6765_10080 [Candidatus Peribacteria bacterium]